MKRRTRSLSIHIATLVLALWFLAMGLLTWAVAQDFQNQISDAAQYMTGVWSKVPFGMDIPKDTPGYGSLQQIMHLGDPYRWQDAEPLLPIVLPQTPDSYGSDDWFWGKWELLYGFQAATVFYDEAGAPLVKSGNLLSMCYITEESWKAENTRLQGIAYLDTDKLPEGTDLSYFNIWGTPQAGLPTSLMFGLVRATGYFEGDEFIPVSLDVSLDSAVTMDKADYESYVNQTCHRDILGALQWENRLKLEAPPDAQLVTIYVREAGSSTFNHKPVSFDGRQYNSLVDYTMEAEPSRQTFGNLINSVFTLSGKADEATGAATYRLTVHTKPLGYACLRLHPVYLLGSLVIGLFLWLLLRSIRSNLTRPLQSLSKSMTSGSPITPCSKWQEVRQAEDYLAQSQTDIHALQNDIRQLNAALDYAKNAEEHRRQLVSNITHELKTPLAVIHGYAEGLQAGIAKDKQAQYLSTILEESEKMDAMVLEMLDMSRLEAGKVRLSADHFSLLTLTQEILNKLAPEERRRHIISFGYCNDCMLVADEGRIAQVVTNLISNALKYTSEGGTILLQVFAHEGSAHFRITNTADHLPEAVLEKLFDSFYRVDASRSDKGTGLGLPIAKSIIGLHRGTLTAKNVLENGEPRLEFAFRIPLQ